MKPSRRMASTPAGFTSIVGWKGAVTMAGAAGKPLTITSWDPGANSSVQAFALHKSVFDTAIELSPDLKIVPGVVTGHRWLDTDGKALELTLRDGVTFHNGDSCTADDLKFSFYDRPQRDEKSLVR